MTMPHLMNCSHSDDGWCLDCVKELHDEKEKLESAFAGSLLDELNTQTKELAVADDTIPNPTKDYKITYHYDAYAKEYVVRLNHPRGYDPLCGCPGELEAKTVSACIAFALAMFDVTWDVHEEVFISPEGSAFNKVEVCERALDTFVAAQDLGEEAATLLKEMAK